MATERGGRQFVRLAPPDNALRPPGPIALLLDAYRRAGADGPFGDPRRDHEAGMEGYYWRFTDAARGRVVVALCGVCASPTGRWAMVALAAHPGGDVRTAVVDHATGEQDGFGVVAGAAVSASERHVRFALGDAVLDVEVSDPWRWPRRALGGSGIAHVVPGLGQYWHPHLLGGRVRGSIRMAGDTVKLDDATVYAEKNWGPSFPPTWWWGQADAFESGDACVAFAGGPMRIAGVALTPTAVVVRIADRLLALRPPAARIVATVSGGRWSVRARSARHSVDLEGDDAGAAVVLPVPVPGRRAWEPRSHQALGGRMGVLVRRGRRTLFRGESALAGLERPCA
jgi:tocopherol cyclase